MVGLVAGLLVLGRHVLEPVVSARFLVDAFGISAVLTGTLRLLGAFEVERRTGRWWTLGGLRLAQLRSCSAPSCWSPARDQHAVTAGLTLPYNR
jgi:hypothetical protein